MSENAGVEGRQLMGPGFPGDAGDADPALESALASYSSDPSRAPQALAALASARLLVPVVAVLGEVDEHGGDKSSDMATVLLTGVDGRQALLAFTSTASLAAWNPDGRPVPVVARDAARAAIQDHADAIVVDVAGPVPFVIEGAALEHIARGFTLTTVGGGHAWIGPAAE